MTHLSQTALELLIQVTLWSTVGMVLLVVVNRYYPLRLAQLALCFLAGIVLLTALVWVPWPSWVMSHQAASSTPVGSNTSLPIEETKQPGAGFDFTLALKSWQQLMPTWAESSSSARQPDQVAWSWGWIVMAIIGSGMVVGFIRLLRAFLYAHQQVAASSELHDEELLRIRNELACQLKLAVSIRLLVSSTLKVPATVGFWKPAILLPANWITWSSDDCRTVLAHELAHIRRTDYLMMVMTQIITIVYWFHPLVRGLSRWMRCGQELAADALAVRVLGDQASYLRSLCRLALDQDGARLPAPARLFLSPEVSLLRRIAMLREGSPKIARSRKSLRWLAMIALIVTASVVASMRSLAAADEPAAKSPLTSTTAWQKYVDPEGPGYVVFHPAAVLSLASLKPHREGLNRMFKDEIDVIPTIRGMGVSLDSIECFAGPLQVQLRKNGEKGTGAITVRGVYCQLRSKADAEAWIKHCMGSVEKVQHELGVYYNTIAKEGQTVTYFLRPDERTIVLAQSEKEVLGWLANADKPVSLPGWLQGLPSDTGLVTTACNMRNKEFKEAVTQTGDGVAMGLMFQPLLDHQGSMMCTIVNSDSVAFQFIFGCNDDEAASKKRKQLEGMMGAIKLLMPAPASINGDEKETAEQQLMIDLITNLKASQEGSIVRFDTHGKMRIGELLKEQILEIKGESNKK